MKKFLRKWLGIPEEKTDQQMRIDIARCLDDALSGKLDKDTCFFYASEIRNRTQSLIKEFTADMIEKEIKNRSKEVCSEYESAYMKHICSEKFIDNVISRINRKQVK